jgi:hypothetical protein
MMSIQRMKLTGAANLVSRDMKLLQAAPAAYPFRSLAQSTRMNDPIKTLEDILKRSGHDLDLRNRNKEENRYFLFDRISAPNDLDLAWSQFSAHREIRARAEEIDAASDIVTGWGYRVPKKSNRCSDTELAGLVRSNLAKTRPLISGSWDDVAAFIDKGYDIQVVSSEAPSNPVGNVLFMALYESMGDFKIDHFPYEQPLLEILYDWAIYLTKCDEVALYLLWPILKNVEAIDPNTPIPGFKLWQYNCRANYWIKDCDLKSGLVCVQRSWAQ